MNKFLILFLAFLLLAGAFLFFSKREGQVMVGSFDSQVQKERPLDKYTIEALSQTKFSSSEINLGEVLTDDLSFTSYIFYFYPEGKKVSGLLNVPRAFGTYPVVVMFRGYADREAYTTGVGTQKAGEVFAKSNFITLAPDFLGYGESDNPSGNPMEERFQTYVVALTLLESVKNLNGILAENNILALADSSKIGIWGHSNGGQIALSVLEITGRSYPTVLWAPVSKPFPYSVLYYTDEFDDRGKMLRRVIAEFEKDYDVELYNLTNYFGQINAPLQVHQGTADDAVPIKWSNRLVEELEKMEKDVAYFTYSGADHNLLPGAWNIAVSRAIEFWRENL